MLNLKIAQDIITEHPLSRSCCQKQIQHQPILIQQISLSVIEAHIYPELEVVSTPVITTDRTLIMDE